MLNNKTSYFKHKHNNMHLYRIKSLKHQPKAFASVISSIPSNTSDQMQTISQFIIKEQQTCKYSIKDEHYKANKLGQNHAIQHNKSISLSEDSSCKLNYNQQKKLIYQNEAHFLQKLLPNDLFFCCSCFQYVFAVERQRHQPYCRDRFVQTSQTQIDHKKAWSKLQQLVKLAQRIKYKQWQIEELYGELISGNLNKIFLIKCPERKWLGLQDLQSAFVYIYQKLLKGRIKSQQFYIFCK